MTRSPYYEEDGITIYHGDALNILSEIDECFEVLLTDPPYSSGGMYRGDRLVDPKTKYLDDESRTAAELPSFTGDSRDQLGFIYWAAAWLYRAHELLTPGGIGGLFCDWRQLPANVMALQAGGFVWRGIVPWYKPNGRPTQGRWGNVCEYTVWGTNGPRSLEAAEGKAFPGFYQASPPPTAQRAHITEKPLKVVRDMLAISQGGSVLDPFMGSGTTLRAAKDLGVRAVGIELEEKYCEIAAKRLGQEVLDLGA